MLVNFTVKNYLSFKDETKFSMKAAPISEHADSHTFASSVGDFKILRGNALYGSNSSGKSNLFRALAFVLKFIQGSAKDVQVNEQIPISIFKLSSQTLNQPSSFEIEVLSKNLKYRYLFTADSKVIYREELYIQRKTKEYKVFSRSKSDILVEEKYSVANKIKDLTRENALFLSTCAMLNIEWASDVIGAFDKFRFFEDVKMMPFGDDLTSTMMEDPKFTSTIQKLLKAGDFGFDQVDSKLHTIKIENIPDNLPFDAKKLFFDNKIRIVSTRHALLDENASPIGTVNLNMIVEESAGTQKFYKLLGPVVEALYYGYVLIIDEFTSKLHPLLAEQIIKLFHCNTINRSNAQLIIATHNTYLLNEELYRRDQISIFKKDEYFSTQITNLFELNVRKDAVFEKRYIQDQTLGGVPKWKLDKDAFWTE